MITIWDFVFNPINNEEKNISSVWDAFVEASYLNGRDIEISFLDQVLTVGNNDLFNYNGKLLSVELKEYHTFFAGTCYQIKSNFLMPPPSSVEISVTFDNSLDESDQPKVRKDVLHMILSIVPFFGLLNAYVSKLTLEFFYTYGTLMDNP